MHYKGEDGQAMVEFALVLPILLLILCGIVDFGWIFGHQLLANNACREAARYTAVHYYDSSTDDDQAVAKGIITSRAPSLNNPTVTLTKVENKDTITISLTSKVKVLTPFLSTILGSEYNVRAQTSMRLE